MGNSSSFGFGGDDFGGGMGGSPFGFSFGSGGGSPFGKSSQYQNQNSGFGNSGFGSGGGGTGRKGETKELELRCTLEELHTGVTKMEKVTRVSYDTGQRQYQDKFLEVSIKPGWKNGTKITFHNEGDSPGPGYSPGDVCFKVVQIPHPHYTRDGHDLVFLARITLLQALTGVKLKVPDLKGKVHEVFIRDVISPNYESRIKGAGMPKPKTPDQFGDIVIRFAIQFPTHIKESDKPALKQILSAK
jgi:DnaJ-class molecular chaperone